MAAPKEYACKGIDAMIKSLDDITNFCETKLEDIHFFTLKKTINSFKNELEELRDDNDKLRAWGEELEEKLNEINNLSNI
jgi:predicted nuclease with TOPRIM domain